MKNLFLIAAIVLLPLTGISAQSNWSLGVKGGADLSRLGIKVEDFNAYNTSTRTGFYVGGLAEYTLNTKWAVQGELMYSLIGAKNVRLYADGGTTNGEYTFRQFSMPFSFKYYIMPKLNVSAGASFGFSQGGTYKYGDPEISRSVVEGSFMSFAPFIGAEYKITKHLFVDARYLYGATNITAGLGNKIYPRDLQVGIGFRF